MKPLALPIVSLFTLCLRSTLPFTPLSPTTSLNAIINRDRFFSMINKPAIDSVTSMKDYSIIGKAAVFLGTLTSSKVAFSEMMNEEQISSVVQDELPPMWVPLVIGLALLAFIGTQQISLGDVMDDEARLGGLSGARAAKKSARNRNMFKRKK